jgi:hypothetical protein
VFSVTKSKIFVEDKCFGFIGGAIDAFSGNQVKVTSKVKNKDLQKQIDAAIAKYSDVAGSGDAALSDYITKYLSQAKDSEVRSNQDINAADQFYNGAMAGQLAQLRAKRTEALTGAATRAGQYALANSNRSRLNDEGGGSSYNTRLLARNVGDINASAAVDESNQERADLGYVTGNQLALAGKRNEMANAQAGYGLVPEQARRQMYQQNLGMIGATTQLDQANKFYGLKQDRNPWANFFDAADQGILNAASIYSSVGGGGMADGGEVEGPGTETSDSIPVRLSDGEFVIRAAVVKMPGVRRALEIINALGPDDPEDAPVKKSKPKSSERYASGGLVRAEKKPAKKAGRMGYAMGGEIGGGMDMGSMGGAGNFGTPDLAATGDWFNSPYGANFWGGSNGDPSLYGTPQQNPPSGANAQPVQMEQKKQSSKSSGGGGGGGGLSGQAMALQAREDRSTGPGEYMPDSLGVPAMVSPEFTVLDYMQASKPSFWGKS